MVIGLSKIPELEREALVQRFKTASQEDKEAMYQQLEGFKTQKLSDDEKLFLSELEADFRAVDFTSWEEESD
ncbi:MAG TPA: hypothetical protein VIL74_07485 [Pyrinomonadaceae bacterium]|jgi:hypothetical protein